MSLRIAAALLLAASAAFAQTPAPVDDVKKQLDEIDAITRQLEQAVGPKATPVTTPSSAPELPGSATQGEPPRRRHHHIHDEPPPPPPPDPDYDAIADIDREQHTVQELLRRTHSESKRVSLRHELAELEEARWKAWRGGSY